MLLHFWQYRWVFSLIDLIGLPSIFEERSLSDESKQEASNPLSIVVANDSINRVEIVILSDIY